jgi:hypothetical protein
MPVEFGVASGNFTRPVRLRAWTPPSSTRWLPRKSGLPRCERGSTLSLTPGGRSVPGVLTPLTTVAAHTIKVALGTVVLVLLPIRESAIPGKVTGTLAEVTG